VDADTVLHAGDRIEEFELGEKVGLDALFPGDLFETHQRRIADSVGDRIINAAASRLRGVRSLAMFRDRLRHLPCSR
jgi:hypothetical protein